MLETFKHKIESVRKNWRPILGVTLLGTILALAYGYTQNRDGQTSKPEGAQPPRSISALDDVDTNTPVNASPTSTTSSAQGLGVYGPYTKLLYAAVPSPAGYEGYQCVTIPYGGYLFDGLVGMGPRKDTRYDSTIAVVFNVGEKGESVTVNIHTDPATWDSRLNELDEETKFCAR